MADFLSWDADFPEPGGALTADVVTAHTCEATAEVTEHPIESGSTIADHVIQHPASITVEFAQSALANIEDSDEVEWKQLDYQVRDSQFTPHGLLALTMAVGAALEAIGAAIGFGGSSLSIWTLSAREQRDRINELHDQLLDVLTTAKTCTFTLGGKVLSGYVLTGVKLSRTAAGEDGLARFTVEARHVETVETAAASLLGNFPVSQVLAAVPLLDLGKQTTEKIEKDVVKKSLLASGLDSLGLGL